MRSNKVRRSRLQVEALEDRLAPATFAVTTFADVVNANDGKISLREAINLANATAEADTIQLQTGVYEIELAGAGEDANATGDFDITNPVTIKGAGATSTFIDGANLDRVFDVLNDVNVKFTKSTIRNGFVTDGEGGGIQAGNGNTIVANCVVSGNTAASGGGIRSDRGNVTLKNSTVTDNSANEFGGGIRAAEGTLLLDGSTLSDNVAVKNGGGIYKAGGTVRLASSLVSDNASGANGGGISTESSTTEIELADSIIRSNVAREAGGGIFAFSGNTLTLTDCTVTGNTAGFDGGGIRTKDGEIILTRCTISNNASGLDGGGIEAYGNASVTATDSTISGNVARDAAANGGGVSMSNGPLTLTRSTLNKNVAGGNGGGINSEDGTVSLSLSTASGNTAENGGGIDMAGGNLTVEVSAVHGNRAFADGGGIRAIVGEVEMNFSTVSKNVASHGGGILSDHDLTMSYSTVYGNRATADGGGLEVYSTASLVNVTLSSNSAQLSGGGAIVYGTLNLQNVTVTRNAAGAVGGGINNQGAVSVRNTIIAGNRAVASPSDQDVSGTFMFASLGHNLIGIGNASSGFTNDVLGDQVGTLGASLKPKLEPLADNGGPTLTHALKFGSPAIDKGNNDSVLLFDQRGPGFPRIKDGDGNGSLVVDIGAFER